MRSILLSIICFLTVSFISKGQATLVLNADQDNTMYSEDGLLGNGSGQYIFVGRTNFSNDRRALLQFDLSSIPQCIDIDSVTLRLNCNRVGSTTSYGIDVHRVTAQWGEGSEDPSGGEGGGDLASTGSSTWTHRIFSGTTWSTSGGDFVGTASASSSIAGTGSYTIRGAGLLTDVQNWLDGTNSNYGWILVGDETTARSSKRFTSGDFSTSSLRPKLTIFYQSRDSLVINEIEYDNTGADTAEYVELKNIGSSALNIDDYTLLAINGSTITAYRTINLPNVSLAAGDYYVICANATNTPNCDLVVAPATNLLQNGAPDALALFYNSDTCDRVSYEGSVTNFTEGTGAGMDDPAVYYAGLSRYPDGQDTDDNSADLSLRCNTPGVANVVDNSGCVRLPVEWLDLRVFNHQGISVLEWETANEINNRMFFIQKLSDDGLHWITLGDQEPMAQNGQGAKYSYTIGSLSSGFHHFRVVQEDWDGSRSYSKTISLYLDATLGHQVYIDNPFAPGATIYVKPSFDEAFVIDVVDLNGKVVSTLFEGMISSQQGLEIQPSLMHLPQGFYLVRVQGEPLLKTKAVVKVN